MFWCMDNWILFTIQQFMMVFHRIILILAESFTNIALFDRDYIVEFYLTAQYNSAVRSSNSIIRSGGKDITLTLNGRLSLYNSIIYCENGDECDIECGSPTACYNSEIICGFGAIWDVECEPLTGIWYLNNWDNTNENQLLFEDLSIDSLLNPSNNTYNNGLYSASNINEKCDINDCIDLYSCNSFDFDSSDGGTICFGFGGYYAGRSSDKSNINGISNARQSMGSGGVIMNGTIIECSGYIEHVVVWITIKNLESFFTEFNVLCICVVGRTLDIISATRLYFG